MSPTYDILNGSVPITNLSNMAMSDLTAVKAVARTISAEQGEAGTVSVVIDGAPRSPGNHPVALFYDGYEVDPDAFVRGDAP